MSDKQVGWLNDLASSVPGVDAASPGELLSFSVICALRWGSCTSAYGERPGEHRYHRPFFESAGAGSPTTHWDAIPLLPYTFTSITP